jgi:DNA primase catalytic subunit
MKKKGWTLSKYHDTMLYQGLYFDVDYDNADYNEGANMMNRLLFNTVSMFNQSRRGSRVRYFLAGLDKAPTMVFSGSKGFHLIFEDWDSSRLNRLEMMRYKAHLEKDGIQKFHSSAKQSIVTKLKEMDEKLLLDWEVTQDPRRIIRLPGTVHGKTMRLCKAVTLDDFDISDEAWTFKADAPIA